MGSETVIFDRSAPVVVDHFRTVLFRAYTVHPVILIGKAAARPAEVGDLQLFQGVEHIITIPLCIRYVRVGTHPKAAINTSSEMLGKLSVDVFADLLCSLLGIHTDACLFLSKQRECQKSKGTDE